MLTTEQIISALQKKLLGRVANTDPNAQVFEETISSAIRVDIEQVWAKSDLIPDVNPLSSPSFGDGSIYIDDGYNLIQKKEKVSLEFIEGSVYAFKSNSISRFIYQPGYEVTLWALSDSSLDPNNPNNYTVEIAQGVNTDYIIDPDSGVILFLNGLPDNVDATHPPRISCYLYIGPLGFEIAQGPTGPSGP